MIDEKPNVTVIQSDTTSYFESGFLEFFFTDLKDEFLGFNSKVVKIRSPSEHLVNGVQFDVEVQIHGEIKPTYLSLDIKYAVISILFMESAEDEQQFKFEPTKEYTQFFNIFKPWQTGP